MYALMTTLAIKAGKRDKLVASVDAPIWQEAKTLLRQIPGYKGTYTLITSGSEQEHYTAFHLFETEAAAKSAVDSPQTQKIWRRMAEEGMADFFEIETVSRTFYEVIDQSLN